MEFDLLITGGRVFGPWDLGVIDIGISGGRIAALGKLSDQKGREVIDAGGKLIFPGLVETHAHMLLPQARATSVNDFYSGTVAAAFGGVTSLIDFADQRKGGRVMDAVMARMEEAEGQCVIDFGFHATLTDINRQTLADIDDLLNFGISSFKFYTIYREAGLTVDDGGLLKAFRRIGERGGVATVHAENEAISERETGELIRSGHISPAYFPQSKPPIVEEEAVERVLLLAREAKVPLVIRHVSSRPGMEAIKRARDRGQEAYGETCPQYLVLTDDVYRGEDGGHFICHPPVREARDRDALWQGIKTGAISLIGTDDCAFTREQKKASRCFYEIPGGLPGIETCLPLLYSEGVGKNQITIEKMVQLTSTDPASLYGLYPQKGTIQVGSDADLVVFDPDREWRIRWQDLHGMADWSPYEGWQLKGKTHITLSRGKVIVREDTFFGQAGDGKFLVR